MLAFQLADALSRGGRSAPIIHESEGFIGSTCKKGHVAATQARISMLGLAVERQGLFGAESGPTHRGRM